MTKWRCHKCGYVRKQPPHRPGKTILCPKCGNKFMTYGRHAKPHEKPNIAQHSLEGEYVTKEDMRQAGFTRRPRED